MASQIRKHCLFLARLRDRDDEGLSNWNRPHCGYGKSILKEGNDIFEIIILVELLCIKVSIVSNEQLIFADL